MRTKTKKKKGLKTARSGTEPPKQRAPRGPRGPQRTLSGDELQGAVRTIAVMSACFQAGNPMLGLEPGTGTDRVVFDALYDAVDALQRARAKQAALVMRNAETRLLDTLRAAVAAFSDAPIAKGKYPPPVARMGNAPARADDTPESRLQAEAVRAFNAFTTLTGFKLDQQRIDSAIRQAIGVRDRPDGKRTGPFNGDDIFAAVIGGNPSTQVKRESERRHRPSDRDKFPYGDVGYFFGATRAPSCGQLAALLGGPAFLANALAEQGPEMAMRCAVYAYEANGLREMSLHRALAEADGGRPESAKFVAERAALHDAVAAVAVALRGDPHAYQLQPWQELAASSDSLPSGPVPTTELRMNTPAVYPAEWATFSSVMSLWALASGK